jgi:AcrR family transcriptional regulator
VTPRTVERRQELRQSLIAAAEGIIAGRGLDALRARELAAEVGCAVGAIYNVFPNLDALILEVNGRTLRAFESFLAESGAIAAAGDGGDGVAGLIQLALVYLEFAIAHRGRWRALFDHRLAEGSEVPDWYREEQARLFALVEAPLARLRPGLDRRRLMLLARTLFSGVHGIVSLGLDAKLMALPADVLRDEVRSFVRVVGAGLLAAPADI